MIKFRSEIENAVRTALGNRLIAITGQADNLTKSEITGTAGWFRANHPDGPVNEYFKRFNNNPAAILLDMRKRFPEVFKSFGFGHQAIEKSSAELPDPAPVQAQPLPAPAAMAGVSTNMLLIIAALVGGGWYFLQNG